MDKNSSKKRIVFFGSEEMDFTSRHLDYFLKFDPNIVGFVVDTRGVRSTTVSSASAFKDIMNIAEEKDVPVFNPQTVKNTGLADDLKKLDPDIFIVCGYQFFLPEEIINLPPMGTLNFHASLLPRHSGMHPGFWTIYYGDKFSGMVIHFMDEGIDTGDIAYQSQIPVKPGDTIDVLYERIYKTCPGLIEKLMSDMDKNAIPRTPQNYSDYIYNYEITGKDYELDFRQPAEILMSRVSMLPGKFYFILDGEKYFIKNCRVFKEYVNSRKFESGKLYRLNNEVFFVTPRGFLEIIHAEKDGKKVDLLSLIK
ncbi:MAG: formyltransferase family protein [Candidatus Humimicrobiaceae bacterium]